MENHILDRINKENDIKKIKEEDYPGLAKEIRRYLIQCVSRNGGHLASNLGVVELTMALHLYLDFPEDKLIWDVGHQSYTHKILTGRKDELKRLRCLGCISGFPKIKESDCDAFNAGHASTAISAALGVARASQLDGSKKKVVAVLGDGALTGGMAYEALNNASKLDTNMIIVLNDNNMSISENVGGMAKYLGKIRTDIKYQNLKNNVEALLHKIPDMGDKLIYKIRRSKDSIKRLLIPGMLFEDMGLTYIGPIDGHNIGDIRAALNSASKMKSAVIVHVITKKGKGYRLAERNPSYFHGVEPFDTKTGDALKKSPLPTYTGIFREALVELGKKNEKLIAVTAAMPQGTGIDSFSKNYPKRSFDVGIAEEHAVTFAAGLAAGGYHPFVAVYSTFLQRGYDQILHDVCIEGLPVTFAVDRAGIVGRDGETHQGCFDLSYLSSIPNMTVMAPADGEELKKMLYFLSRYQGPSAVRYPRGGAVNLGYPIAEIRYGKGELIIKENMSAWQSLRQREILEEAEKEGRNKSKKRGRRKEKAGAQKKKVLILAIGSMVETGCKVSGLLKEEAVVSVWNARFLKPLDKEGILSLAGEHSIIVTMEENVAAGGFGQQVAACLISNNAVPEKFIPISIPDVFVRHGERKELLSLLGMDAESVAGKIRKEL